MSESGNQLSDSLTLPLRSHVADSMNCSESELATVFKVSREVPVGGPGSPLLGDGPWLLLDPSAGSQSRYSAVSVSRVVHQTISIWVAQQDVVDPDRSLS